MTNFSHRNSGRGDRLIEGVVEPSKVNEAPKRISLQERVVTFLLIDLCMLVAFGVVPEIIHDPSGLSPLAVPGDRLTIIGFAAALFLLLSRVIRAYQSRRILDSKYSIRRLIIALGATFIVLIVIGAATKTSQNYSRVWFFSWAALSCTLIPASRLGLLTVSRHRFADGAYVFRALSVGLFANPLAREAIAEFSDGQVNVAQELRMSEFAEIEGLADLVVREEIDQIYVVTPWVEAPVILQQLLQLRKLSTEIFILPDDARIHAHHLGITTIGDRVSLRATERAINGWDLWAKRAQDIAVASSMLVLFAPFMALIALAIKLESPGPLLFRQKRVGFNGRHFELFKFRSMYVDAADADASRQTSRDDDRVTRVGKFIRSSSLDELPQFLNVLQGVMSVVGPRPHALMTKTNGVALADIANQYAARHRVKPGLTGWAQVNGFRGELDTNDKVKRRVELDINYIENWSTWLDLKIILRTALVLIRDPSAY